MDVRVMQSILRRTRSLDFSTSGARRGERNLSQSHAQRWPHIGSECRTRDEMRQYSTSSASRWRSEFLRWSDSRSSNYVAPCPGYLWRDVC